MRPAEVAWSLLHDPDPVAAGRAGVAAAACAVQHFGSHEAVLSLGELDALVERVDVQPCDPA